jgi:SAM-dependent methyltransferase
MTEKTAPSDLFLEGWKNYQSILNHDYLWHRMAGDALKQALAGQFKPNVPMRFLDLACGDAATTGRVLRNLTQDPDVYTESHPTIEYLGVDSSPMALTAATRTEFGPNVRPTFVEADFVDFLKSNTAKFHTIYVGMSAHHLGVDRLPDFFAAIRERLAPSGVFIAYEPFCLADESRDEQIARLHAIIRNFWVGMSPEARDNVIAHTATYDFPVTFDVWNDAAVNSGLKAGRFLAKSPDRLYAMIMHEP